MKIEKIEMNIKKTVVYKKGSEIIEMIQNMTTPTLPMVILAKWNPTVNKLEFYVDEIKDDLKIGMCPTGDPSLETVKDVLEEGLSYKIFLDSVKGNTMHGVMEVQVPEIKAVEVAEDESFEQLKKKILENDICTEEVLEKNIQIMRQHRCPEELIRQVLFRYKKLNRPAHIAKTIYVDPDQKQTPSMLSMILVNILIGSPLIFEGDKSVGKNVCAETVAQILNLPYDCVTMTRSMTGDDLYGTKATDNSAAEKLSADLAKDFLLYQQTGDRQYFDGASEYESLKAKAASVSIVQEVSSFMYWVQNGGLLCLNEMNMAEANFLASFANQLTDGTGFLDIAGYGRVYVHPDCVLIGTQNAEYTGTCEQNDATISRFGCIQFEYPKSIKKQLKAAVGNTLIEEEYFSQMDAYYKEMLKAVKANKVENACLNIRGCVRALKAAAVVPGLTTLKAQIKIHVIDTCPVDDREMLMLQLDDIVKI